jgi:ABC-2 type transport system permease protein
MTTDAAPRDLPALDVSGTPRVPFSRLVAVEARKMTDTRAGFWLLLVTGLLMLAVAAVALLVVVLNDLAPGFMIWATQIMVLPVSLLLPVFAITTVTSEWGQRTSLVTFALEPHRSRVLLAKFVTVLVLAVVTMALALLLAVVGAGLQGALGESPSWEVEAGPLFWAFMTQLLYFVMAFGLGLVLLNSAAAVVLYYVVALLLPLMVWGPVYGLVSWGPDVIPWFDIGFSIAPLTTPEMPRPDAVYAQIAVSTLIWVVLPVSVGLRRALRTELK